MDDQTKNQQSVFNEPDLIQRLMGDTDLEKAVIAAFLSEIPELILQLKQFVDAGNIANARLQAHTIRGAAANLSAGNLRAAAEQIEELCKQDDLESCKPGIAVLETEFDRFTNVTGSLGLLHPLKEKA